MKTKILNIIFSLGTIFALAITAHAQNLYVSVVRPGEILEYTPSGVQSTYASLSAPRGLGFDSLGNLFAAENLVLDDGLLVGRVLKSGRITRSRRSAPPPTICLEG